MAFLKKNINDVSKGSLKKLFTTDWWTKNKQYFELNF